MNVKSVNTERAVHLIDLENICGQPLVSFEAARAARAEYERAVGVGPEDQVIVATSRINAFAGFEAWPDARHLWRDGPDGADICLALVMLDEHLAARFDTAFVASGDGGLAEFVCELRLNGMHTVVVARSRGLAYRMNHAGNARVLLPASHALAA